MNEHAETLRHGGLDMQVCCPWTWTDEQILFFAEEKNPCGTQNGWYIRKEGTKALKQDPERVQCVEYKDNCHVMLDA